jgi:hypothetical protein
LTEFDLATCRYQSRELILPSGLRPCGISVGRPKFPLGYTPLYLGELAPYGLLGIEDGQEFSASYIDRLGSVGVEVLAERFAAIVAEHQTRGLVYLCFEPVGQNCHRHLFRGWWEHETGQPVPELSASELHLFDH